MQGAYKRQKPMLTGAPTENGPYRQCDPTDKVSLHTKSPYIQGDTDKGA